MSKVKQAIILVTVHEDGKPQPSVSRSTHHKAGESKGLFVVDIYPTDLPDGAKFVELTAHEFGHVLQELFNTEAHVNDPRRNPSPIQKVLLSKNIVPPEPLERMIAAESEAWDFAQSMWPDLDPTIRKANLDTYKEGLEIWHKEAAAR
jgi:hypothetical protein